MYLRRSGAAFDPPAILVTNVGAGGLRLDDQLNKVLHERLERDVVGVDDLRIFRVVAVSRFVCLRGVDLGEQEPRLASSLVAQNELRRREALAEDVVRVARGGLQQLLEVGVVRLVLEALLAPLVDHVSVPDDDVEERVQHEDDVLLQRARVEQHRVRRGLLEGVLQQRRLDHNEAVDDVLPHEHRAVERRLVGTGVERLQEVRPPQVVHELRVDGELVSEPECVHVVPLVVGELGYEADEALVQPAQHRDGVLSLTLVEGIPGHENRSRFLVERGSEMGDVWLCVLAAERCDPEALLTARVEVHGLELNERSFPRILRGPKLVLVRSTDCAYSVAQQRGGRGRPVRHIEIERQCGFRVDSADHPLSCASLSDNVRRHVGSLFVGAAASAHHAAHLQLLGAEHLYFSAISLLQISR
ncbi:hypothetical protein BOVATA_023730 [Babesia ovata]|uniref:Uncharacterized protein n=1 Tax=Babesia ovata TaxID=189622 RepID=A0A2H6KD07_9APIC|nr:uncharacterized protein BOVATA_023730 [Babesia ovata]GBE60880.1 hypothetical protein BOVATA_023730 [Babesia ovata]